RDGSPYRKARMVTSPAATQYRLVKPPVLHDGSRYPLARLPALAAANRLRSAMVLRLPQLLVAWATPVLPLPRSEPMLRALLASQVHPCATGRAPRAACLWTVRY